MAKYVLAISKDIEKLSKRVDETNVVVKYDTCKKIISDLKATLKANPKLVALAAPQIGYNERIFCLKCLDGKIKAYINPIIIKTKGMVAQPEVTPSLPDKEYMICRPELLSLGFQESDGTPKSDVVFKYPLSVIVDQMIDILDGTLFFKYSQLGIELDEEYYKASQEDREELQKYYVEVAFPNKRKALEDAVKDDKEVNDYFRYQNLLTKLATKEINLAHIDENGNVIEKPNDTSTSTKELVAEETTDSTSES